MCHAAVGRLKTAAELGEAEADLAAFLTRHGSVRAAADQAIIHYLAAGRHSSIEAGDVATQPTSRSASWQDRSQRRHDSAQIRQCS